MLPLVVAKTAAPAVRAAKIATEPAGFPDAGG